MAYNVKLAERIRSQMDGLPFVDSKHFDITGKPMKGWLLVEPSGVKTDKQLSSWVKEGIEFASALPPK